MKTLFRIYLCSPILFLTAVAAYPLAAEASKRTISFDLATYTPAALKPAARNQRSYPPVSSQKLPLDQETKELLDGNRTVDEVSSEAVWDLIQGGDIIGNGTGITEVRFFESYYALPALVKRCLESSLCPISYSDRAILQSITEVLKVNLRQRHQLLFLSGSAYPRFFVDSDQIGPRTAKTGFRMGLPIFLNRDHFYKNGAPNIQTKEAIAILIHELGHQTGERSHTLLDGIGTKFATWATGKSYFLQRKIEDDFAEFSVMNSETPNRWPLTWISWRGNSISFTAKLKEDAKCKDQSREAVGASLSNLHWRREFLGTELKRISASAWVTLYCLGEDSLIYEEDHSIDVDYTIVFQPEQKEFIDLHWNSEKLED